MGNDPATWLDQLGLSQVRQPLEGARTVNWSRLMTSERYVRVLNVAFDKDGDRVILRGRLDPDTLDALRVDDYQREELPNRTIEKIMSGFETPEQSVPDVDLGMRGSHFNTSDGSHILCDPVYIIDGLQRITAAKRVRERGGTPLLGATIHFDSTKKWEVDRFEILNAHRTKLAPSVLLRNRRWISSAVELLYSMCQEDPQFVLKDKVCWDQRKGRTHLVYATMVGRCICLLHAYENPGMSSSVRPDDMADSLDQLMEKIGQATLQSNIRRFYSLIDECWGIRNVRTTDRANQLKLTFMMALAYVLDNHGVFWRDNRLTIERDLVRKFRSFRLSEHAVSHLCGASGKAPQVLYGVLASHLNKGKRNKRLQERRSTVDLMVETGDDDPAPPETI